MAESADLLAALPEYEVGGELGRGGFGLVRAGRHRHLHRSVAIKELPAALASDPKVRARFATEARVLAQLSHPHIVPIYDYVERDGLCLLVMEHLPGGTVWSLFKERGLTPETTCAVVMAVCAGLQYAHQHGVLHRDIKPENLLFSAEQVLKITDFGIAKVVGGSETLATRGGEILGTPAYMAPEQAEGRELGPEADVYATGILLYELLSGHLPYSEDGGALAVVYRHVYEDAIPLLDVAPHLPPGLADVTMQAIERSTKDRFPTAEAFGVALGEAGTVAWGADWLRRSEVQILDAGPIPDSTKRVSGATALRPPPPAPPDGTVRVPPPPASSGHTGGTTRAPAAGTQGSRPLTPAAAASYGNETVGRQPSGNETKYARPPSNIVRVRPQVEEHVVGGGGAGFDTGAEFVPVREVIELPSPPYAQAAAAVALLILALAIGFLGLSSPSRAKAIGAGVASVAGVDPAESDAVSLDLSKPIEVRLRELPAQAATANKVQLGLSIAGVPMPASTTEDLTPSDTGLVANVEANSSRYFVAGEATGELRLLYNEDVVLRHEFRAESEQSAFLTVPGVLVVALTLFVLAYIESLLRPLRRGRRRVTGIIGMSFLGAGLGLVIVPLAWLLGGPEPTPSTAIVCMVLGALAAVSAALAAIRVGKRARIKPKRAAEEAKLHLAA